MGDSERSLPPEWETRETSGLSNEGVDSFTTAFRTFRSKGEEWWAKAELQAAKLITSIQPNPASETRRLAVAAYVTKVIKSCINCEVVKFGSVPLKTYLPDGDVDLTVICPNIDAKVTWIEDVHNVLQKEINNPKSKFRVTQVQLVSPQVQIIKMYIENLRVDVSFDQVGGLCTLCFLEEVDNLIGEDHLFKRSIILVKAWCFYESRLLGANCNLLSSYALEILVIHIFDIFHESLKGPLQVLYLFLEFFSCFDWDSYCVSLSGPIPLELKPKQGQSSTGIKDEKLERELHDSKAFRDFSSSRRERGELLFTKAFLEACEKKYGLIPRSQAINESTKFTVKSLNILDPLRRTNNLGRSVNQGNCARIRRAFVLGARTFRSLLQASEADVTKELDQFFKNCNLRQRPDVGPSSSAQGESLPNGAQKIGCARRSDMAKAKPDVPSQNGGHPASQTRLISTILLPEESDKELHLGVHEGASAVESASHGEENTRDVSTVAGKGEVGALDLNGKSKTADSNGRMYHDTLDIDEDYFHVAKTRIPSPLQNPDPILLRSYEEDELSSPGVFSARSSPRECLDAETRVGCARISKRDTSANGIQQRSNGSTSSSSKIDSEEDDDSLSQSSLKGEHVTASESPSVLGVPDLKRGLLSLSCQSANSEGCRNDSSSELQGRPPDPHHSTSVVASADAAPTEAQTESLRFSSEQLLSVRNEEEREFSYVRVDLHKQTGNDPGSEYPDISCSEGVRRKGKNHHQNGAYPSKELLLSSGVPGQHGKSKRGRGEERRAQEGGQVSSSSGTAHSPQQASPVYSQHAMHPHRHSSGSDATSGTSQYFKQAHPYPNATGTGSFRHQNFDPGTARMPSSGSSSSSSHSPRPQYFAPYPFYPPAMHYPQFQQFAIYTPVQKRLPPAKWEGSSGANIFKSRLMQDQDTIQAPGPSDFSVDSSTRNLNQIKISEQSAVGVGVVESLEAREEFATSENFRKSHPAKNGNSHGAEGQLLNGSTGSSDFLAGNLKLHLDSLEYGRFCEQSCSPSVQHFRR